MMIIRGPHLKALRTAVAFTKACAPDAGGNEQQRQLQELLTYLDRLERGVVLVPMAPKHARAVSHALSKSREDLAFRRIHLTGDQRASADQIAVLLSIAMEEVP